MGRKTILTEKLAYDILDDYCTGKSLAKVLSKPHMPSAPTFFTWLRIGERDKEEGVESIHRNLLEDYNHCVFVRYELMSDELLEIADDDSLDLGFKETEGGASATPFIQGGNIQRSRLKVDTRKWLMSKKIAKKYGDKQTTVHEGEVTTNISKLTAEEAELIAKELKEEY
jgi:hypothetical protein